MSNFIQLLPLVAALATGGVANAAQVQISQSVVVKYGDLDLNTRTGVKTLHARLRTAAREVCAPSDGRALADTGDYDACVSNAVTRAVSDVGNPNLTRLHRYGRVGVIVAAN